MADLNVGRLTFDLDVDATDFKRGLATSRKDIDDTFGKGTQSTTQFSKGVQGANTQVVGLSKSLKGMAGIAAASIGGAAVLNQVKSVVNAASSLEESQSKVTQVFTDQSGTIVKWSETTASSFGISQQAALEAAGTYGNLFQAFGVGAEAASTMSTNLVELAADLASFNNTSIDDALVALRSGLSGETEPLKRYGVALTDARMKAEAMAAGIYDGVGALDAGQKAQAAYALILKDTVLAQGDIERTQDSLANQTRFLSAEFSNLQANLGKELLPAMTELVKTSTGILKWANANTELIGSLLKVTGALGTTILLVKGYNKWLAPTIAKQSSMGASAKLMATRVVASWGSIAAAAKSAAAASGPFLAILAAIGAFEGLQDQEGADAWRRFNPDAPGWVGNAAAMVDKIPLVSDYFSMWGKNPMDPVRQAMEAEAQGREIDRRLAEAGAAPLGVNPETWNEVQTASEAGTAAWESYMKMIDETKSSFLGDHPLFGEVAGREARRAADERVRIAKETVREEKAALDEIARYYPQGSERYMDAQKSLSDAQKSLREAEREADKARGLSSQTLLRRARRQGRDASRDADDMEALIASDLSSDAITGLLDIESSNPGTIRRLVKDGITGPWVDEVNEQFSSVARSADIFAELRGSNLADEQRRIWYEAGKVSGDAWYRGFIDADPSRALGVLDPTGRSPFRGSGTSANETSGITINGGLTVQANDPTELVAAMQYEERKLSLQGRG